MKMVETAITVFDVHLQMTISLVIDEYELYVLRWWKRMGSSSFVKCLWQSAEETMHRIWNNDSYIFDYAFALE